MEAHEDVLTSLKDMGGKLAETLDPSASDKADLQKRIRVMNGRWTELAASAQNIRYLFYGFPVLRLYPTTVILRA